MKKILNLTALLLFMFTATISFAQDDPVKWDVSHKQVDGEIEVTFKATIADDWHLYSPNNPPGGGVPLEVYVTEGGENNAKKIGKTAESPKPKEVFDDIFEKMEHYFEHEATFKQKFKVLSENDFTLQVTLDYQVCLSNGMCKMLSKDFEFPAKGFTATVEPEDNPDEQTDENIDENTENEIDTTKGIIDTLPKEVQDTVVTNDNEGAISLERGKTTPIIVSENNWKNQDEKRSVFWFFLVAFGAGLIALLTPCVFPMIPMTVSFFIKGEGEKAKGRMQALIYGISIVAIYTVPIALIIIFANLVGKEAVSADFANWLSTHWAPNIFFFLIFVVFAASFFGMFEIRLPSWLLNSSDKQTSKGGLIGVFFMAFTLVLVSFSCTGPIVGGIFAQSTQGGDLVKPIIGMLGFSMGVALPFTLFAFFPSMLKKLPKSGGWLNSVKVILGFVELALGLKFLSVADQTYHWGILDREVYIALWIVIFGLMGLYLLGKIKFSHDSDMPFIKVPRLMLAIAVFTFVVYLIPGMFGAPLKALSGYLPPNSTHDFNLAGMIKGDQESTICEKPKYEDELHLPHGLRGYYEVYQALNCSKENKKPIFIDFTGHGCVNCRQMEENVWSDPRVLKMLKEDYIILSLYVDDKKVKVPEIEWFVSTADGKTKKTLGKQNADIQVVNFNKSSQPYYVLLDHNGVVLAEPTEFDPDVDNFVEFLEAGKKEYARLHPF